jgi:hypothetical protein
LQYDASAPVSESCPLRLAKDERRRADHGQETNWVKNWLRQPHPVMLVVGTFAEKDERSDAKDKLQFDQVR